MDNTSTASPTGSVTAASVLEVIKREVPSFHGKQEGQHQWGIKPEVLEWIAEHAGPGQNTLETGSGHSTLIFAAAGANHTAISPAPQEHRRIAAWCDEHGVPSHNVRFLAEFSQDVLPGLTSEGELDIVLIDGAHAFPFPFLDWYYTAPRVRPGGYVMVDDTHLITGKILAEFMAMEESAGRWKTAAVIGKTSIFEKLSEEVFGPGEWRAQPYCFEPWERVQRFKSGTRLKVYSLIKEVPGVRPLSKFIQRRMKME